MNKTRILLVLPCALLLAAGTVWAQSPYDMPYAVQWSFIIGNDSNDTGLTIYHNLDVAESLNCLGGLLMFNGDTVAAEPLLREALAIREKALPEGHESIARTRSRLGACLAALGYDEEAEP